MTPNEEIKTAHEEHIGPAHQIHHTHHRVKKELTTPMAIIVGSVIIAVGLMGYGYTSTLNQSADTAPKAFLGKAIEADEAIFGVSKKVFIIEYSDTECPYCVSFNPTIEKMRSEYKDKVGFVYRFFPLTSIHPKAQKEAEAIACAGKLGGAKSYFEYMTAMFDYKTNNRTTQLKPTGLKDLATEVGLDANALTACVDSGEMSQRVTDSINDGVTAGVSGTPTTFIVVKDRKGLQVTATVVGAQTEDYMRKAIEDALDR